MVVRFIFCAAILSLIVPETSAQTGRASQQNGTRSARTGQSSPRSTVSGHASTAGRARPTARPTVQQQQLSPQLEQILQQWAQASARIKKIEGSHQRRVYDMVFKSEKKSLGKFYHEVPDKGRIDIEPSRFKSGALSERTDKATGQPFRLAPDLQEKWICDGKQIIMINEKEKSMARMSIPPQAQGENIMNGPLPFLFGMPAETAKARYWLKLGPDKINPRSKRREIQILARPRWPEDRRQWREARIILDFPTFVPLHVKLVDTTGKQETVYSFANIRINKPKGIFQGDPFRPNLRGYKLVSNSSGGAKTTNGLTRTVVAPKTGERRVPDIAGISVKQATSRLRQAGFRVDPSCTRGGPAPNSQLVYKVRTSRPQPNTSQKIGSVVKLVVWEASKTAARR